MSDINGGATRAPSLELQGESLGLIRVVIPGNEDGFTPLSCWRHCSDMSGLILQGENLDSNLRWLDPVTEALVRRSLLEGVAVEELCRPCDVMR